jgi:NAD(P)H dehydrogenase (quinone)
MRVLVLYAHPSETSFGSALHRRVLEALQRGGHTVDDCDLYAEGFDPVLSREEFRVYNDEAANRVRIASYVDRLLEAEALILVYPIWNEGFPAILKGFLDRVFLPGVSFAKAPDGKMAPALSKITKLGAVCSYGAGHLATMVMGDPCRRVVKRLMRAMMAHHVRCNYLALYQMDSTTPAQRTAFLNRVGRTYEGW